jgi:hypothetical protein
MYQFSLPRIKIDRHHITKKMLNMAKNDKQIEKYGTVFSARSILIPPDVYYTQIGVLANENYCTSSSVFYENNITACVHEYIVRLPTTYSN